jgi:hypothetical protein
MTRHSRTVLATVSTAALLVGAIGLGAAPAQALPTAPTTTTGPSCGAVISSDTVLRDDLHCHGTALTVAAAPGTTVRLDLNGHLVSGDGTGTGIAAQAAGPVVSTLGTVVLSNGTVRGFADATGGPDWSFVHLTLDRMTLRGNGDWVTYSRMVHTLRVLGTQVVDSGAGGIAPDTTLEVQDSTFVRSDIRNGPQTFTSVYRTTFVGAGLSQGASSRLTAVGNTFSNCQVGILTQELYLSIPARIEGNRFDRCVTGLWLGYNVRSLAGSATVRGNTFTRISGTAFLFTFGSIDFGGVWLHITGNTFSGNGGDGMYGGGTPAVVVTQNTALSNGGHGIVVIGVTDGGHNRAARNHTPPQCIGVVCSQ